MFSLWRAKSCFFIHKTNKINKLPSPKCKKIIPDKFFYWHSLEKTSPFISARLGLRKVCAGMTVEAAVVLPIFLFFFVNLGSAMEMIRLHQNLQMGLWNIGNRLCVYGCAVQADASGDQKELLNEIGDLALTYTYVKRQVTVFCGEDYLTASPLNNGAGGLQFLESNVLSQNREAPEDIVDLIVTYQVSPWLEIPFVKPFRMSNRYYGKMWTGYGIPDAFSGKTAQEMVYVTENRKVYHENLECTHLKLSIHKVSEQELQTARNAYGSRYYLCSKCGKKGIGEKGEIYVCEEGDFYHYNRNCPGLTRIISTITRQQAYEENLRLCSRCAAGKK